MKSILSFLGLVNQGEYEEDIEERLFMFSWQAYHIMHALLCVCSMIILLVLCLEEGGPLATPRRSGYFYLQIMLLVVSILFIAADILWSKKRWTNCKAYVNLGFAYTLFITIWSCGITLLDQLGGNGLVVYTYMLLMAAVLNVLKPWQSIVVFFCPFVLLNIFLPYFPTPTGVDCTYSDFANSLFVMLIAIVISVYFNENRIKQYRTQQVIDNQNHELSKVNEMLRQEIIVDNLTGLYNRRYLADIVHRGFSERIENGGKSPIACIMVDVDFFKQYNDAYGHQRGDDCLKKISEIMRKCFSMESAKIIRYGGEEFLIFIFDCDRELGAIYAEDLRGVVEKSNFARKDIELGKLTVSMGIYVGIPDREVRMREFIRRADLALYEAKRAGRNCVRIYEEA